MTTKLAPLQQWIKQALKQDPPRSKSLIVTIFGDSILPHARSIWLSELIALLAPFHVNERLVRTSAFRLTEEGWLEAQRHGRRSRYSLTASALNRVQNAYHRIYDPPPKYWSGAWTLAVLNKSGMPAAARAELRHELGWEGFGLLAPGIFLHPAADLMALQDTLHRLKLSQKVAILEARVPASLSSSPATTFAAGCWNLDLVRTHYQSFLKQFEPAYAALHHAAAEPIEPKAAFLLQTLLIHAFRRAVLHDPRLPAALLPKDWPGHAAYRLCRDLYRLTAPLTRDYLAAHIEDATRPPAKSPEALRRRFAELSARRT